MKRRILVVLFFFILLLVNACSKGIPTILKNEKCGYELTFPRGWFLHQHDTKVLKHYAAQTNGDCISEGIYNNRKGWGTEVLVWKINEYNTFEGIYKKQLNAYKGFGPLDGKIIETRSYLRDGNEYREVIFETSGFGPKAKHQSTIIDKDDYVLIIHSSCKINYFDSAKKDFDYIVDSLKFF